MTTSWKNFNRTARSLRQLQRLDAFPFQRVARDYRSSYLGGDFRAGFNVALLAFPQGMAYAAIAGLPIEYGVFGSAVAAIVGPLFSGSRYIMLGPTNATAALMFGSFLSLGLVTEVQRVAALPIVVLLAGVFLIFGAVIRVANLIQYVSRAVVTGYLTAAALYIIVNQVRKVFGYSVELGEGSTFLDLIWGTLANLPQMHLPTVALSVATTGTYLALQRYFRTLPNVAITLVLMSVLAIPLQSLVQDQGWALIDVHTPILAQNWHLVLPLLNYELASQLAFTSLVIAFLAILEGTSIGKSLAARAGERLDANQEMFGMGMANLGCAFLQGMPASGSLTRSALNWTSGAMTPVSSVICGLICAVGVFLVGPFTRYIPQSALGVLVIAIGVSLINRHVLKVVWTSTRSDRIVFLTTFISALLLRLDFAIIMGAGVSVLLFLQKAAQPELIEYAPDAEGGFRPIKGPEAQRVPEVSIVHVEGELFFGAAELFRDQMRRVCGQSNLRIVILKMRNAHHLDATSVLALEELIRYMRDNDRLLLVSEAREDALRIFRNSGLDQLIGAENLFADDPANPTLSTSRALKRARQILGGQEADVKIFVGTGRREQTEPSS